MDVLTVSGLTFNVKTAQPEDVNPVENTGLCDQSGELRLSGPVDAAHPPSSPPPAAGTSQRVYSIHQRSTPASLILPLPLDTDSSLSLTLAPCPLAHEAQPIAPHVHGTLIPTSLPSPAISSWVPMEDPHKSTLPLPVSLPLSSTMMEPGPVSALTDECLLQPSRTCLGCFIETTDHNSIHETPHDPTTIPDPEPGLSVRIGDVGREDFSDISNISIQCLSHAGEAGSHYGEQLLSDQLLNFPLPKAAGEGKRGDGDKITDCDDPEDDATTKNLYEGLLLDKVSGEEVLLANAGQDWGYFESFISESKMELLDLCSKNELSVNLFSEEDVDNLFDDEDDDSTLSSDVCSLKIRYESFQDNMREKTNVLQEETQFNFFPSVLANCGKKEDGVVVPKRGAEKHPPKSDELILVAEQVEKAGDCSSGSPLDGSQGSPMSTPKVNYLLDFNSTEESGEYSDDSSCTASSSDTLQEGKIKKGHSRRFLSPSNPLNYGLRSKRKVRYSDDYLYDVDSIESEKNTEKKEKAPSGQKEEEDVDWCPKKRRKSCRKEPPVVIKYIIINRFKGEKHMSVKLGRMDPVEDSVSLNADSVSKYETLAPLKNFWQERQREREAKLKLAARDKRQCSFHLNGRHHRPFNSSHPKRKYKIANRLKVQRIHMVEQSATRPGSSLSDQGHGGVIKEEATPMDIAGGTEAPTYSLTLDSNAIAQAVTAKSRSQEREEREARLGGNATGTIRKFKSEARLRILKMKAAEGKEGRSVTNGMHACATVAQIEGPTAGLGEASSNTVTTDFSDTAATNNPAEEKCPFVSSTCSPDKGTSSEEVEAGVSVIPGGYLQTLLDGTDSSGGAAISYFPQQPSRQQYPLGLSLEGKQFTSMQLAQSCVLSPPSESELQQSPQNCPNFPQMWHPQLCPSHSQSFGPKTPETPILPNNFPTALPLNDSLPVSNYNQLSSEADRLLYEKSYLAEAGLQPGADMQVCQSVALEGQVQYQRGSLCTDNGRLISYDSVGSLSASSSNYSSLSLKSSEREGDEEGRDNFLAHCSPKVVIQQSVDALTPLRESSDLLDISNFTPDKFRHSSLSELSPPETPNLSPQVVWREIKMAGKAGEYQEGNDSTLDNSREVKWNCDVIQQQEHSGSYTVEDGQFTLQHFNSEGGLGLDNKVLVSTDFDEHTTEMNGIKSTKSKKKGSYKQTPAGQGPKKSRAPKAAKTEKVKVPKQNSRSTKKIKAMLEGKAAKNQAGSCGTGLTDSSSTGDWSGTGWSENNNLVGDDQREFEEPSNILSNIVSGMAEVQRFMMASIEPLWDPMSEACITPEANSLNLKTLKILAGTEADLKKKGALLTGAGRGRKAGGKGGKNQAKFNPSHPLFPQLALGCNMFDKPNFINPGPAHKKLYRHKTSAKFPRIETLKGKRAERDPNKDIALMASFETLR